MARRRQGRKGVLEWVTLTNMITAATHTTAATELDVIDLDLNPDEVAEIKMIESYINIEPILTTLGRSEASIVLGTDPSSTITPFASTDPYVSTTFDNLEDEEVFYSHFFEYFCDREATATGTAISHNKYSDTQVRKYEDNPPMLVGRNIGMNTTAFESAAVMGDVLYLVRIWFKRRKGAPEEILNLIKH